MRTRTDRRSFRPNLVDGLQALPPRILLDAAGPTVVNFYPPSSPGTVATAYSVTYSGSTTPAVMGPPVAPTCSMPTMANLVDNTPTCSTPTMIY